MNTDFDPLYPNEMQRVEIRMGYLDGQSGKIWPAQHSAAYAHGRKMGFNAARGEVDAEQRDLVKRAREHWLNGKWGRDENILHPFKRVLTKLRAGETP